MRPQPGTFGNVARDSFFGPHLFNADMNLSKNFRITETVNGQFRAESFNIVQPRESGAAQCHRGLSHGRTDYQLSRASPQMRKWQFGLRVNF